MDEKKRKEYYCGVFAQLRDYDYWLVLVNLLDEADRDIWQVINGLAKEEDINFLHAYVLWDKLFYERQNEFPFEDIRFYGQRYEYKRGKMVQTIRGLWKKHELLQEQIELVASHWLDLRNHFFEDEKQALDCCEMVEDYERFIKHHKDTYGEFILVAQLRIAELTHQPFRQFGELKSRYPNSDYVVNDIKRIETTVLNGREVQWMYSKEVEENSKLKKALQDFMISFMGPFDEIGKNRIPQLFVLRDPIALPFWRTIIQECGLKDPDLLFPAFNTNGAATVLAQYKTFEKMAAELSNLLSIDFFIPTSIQLDCIRGCITGNECAWEWVQSRCTDPEFAGVVGRVIGSNLVGAFVHYIPKTKYADCRLAFLQ